MKKDEENLPVWILVFLSSSLSLSLAGAQGNPFSRSSRSSFCRWVFVMTLSFSSYFLSFLSHFSLILSYFYPVSISPFFAISFSFCPCVWTWILSSNQYPFITVYPSFRFLYLSFLLLFSLVSLPIPVSFSLISRLLFHTVRKRRPGVKHTNLLVHSSTHSILKIFSLPRQKPFVLLTPSTKWGSQEYQRAIRSEREREVRWLGCTWRLFSEE